jgi:hypothetical protein
MNRFQIIYALIFIHSIELSQSSLVETTSSNLLEHLSSSTYQNNYITSTEAISSSILVKPEQDAPGFENSNEKDSLIATSTILNCEVIFGPCTYGNYDSYCNCIPIPMCFTGTEFCDNTYGNCSCILLSMIRPDPQFKQTTNSFLETTTPFSLIRKCGKRK